MRGRLEIPANKSANAVFECVRVWLQRQLCLPWLAGPVALTPQASAESTTLKAVIFEEVKPLNHKTHAGYEGLGVDVFE